MKKLFASITIPKNTKYAEIKISQVLLHHFEKFKTKNELSFCSFNRIDNYDDAITVSYNLTRRFKDKTISDIEKDFSVFCDENYGEKCIISKISIQENVTIAEYTVYRLYKLYLE